jgi:ketosteroid isomerase-like protein
VAKLYTAGGQLLPPNSEIVAGHDAIRAFWQGAMDLGLKEATLDTVEVEGAHETAVEVGKYTLRAAGGQIADVGKYVVVWKAEAGAWRLHRDIWNSSRPAPPK